MVLAKWFWRIFMVVCGLGVLSSGILAQQNVKVLIIYYSKTGNTQAMAEGVKEGVDSVGGATAILKAVNRVTTNDVDSADGIILGSPTYWGNISYPIKHFLDNTGFWGGKVGGAFSTGGMRNGGKENVVISLMMALLMKGVIVVGPIYDFGTYQSGGVGASAMTGSPDEGISDSELEDARQLGARVARVALQLKAGSPTRIPDQGMALPRDYRLYPNYPNPFNPETTIRYEIRQPSQVHIQIVNPLGRKIRTLLDEKQLPGSYRVQWDGRDNFNRPVSSGIYFLQLVVNGTTLTEKMMLLH